MESTCGRVDILFVAVEHCTTYSLQAHLHRLSNANKLARIVVDECHLTLTWTSFRPAMRSVYTLRQQNVPLLLLSATVPPAMELELKVRYASDFTVVRAPTTVRAALVYSVIKCGDYTSMGKGVVARIYQKKFDSCCGIIYTQRIAECQYLQDILQEAFPDKTILKYHGQMAEDEKKIQQAIFSSQSNNCFMVATSAFGTGIDKGNVQFVYHHGTASSVLEYIQESGRAARSPSGLESPGDCAIFTYKDEIENLESFRVKTAEPEEEEAVKSNFNDFKQYLEVRKYNAL